MLRAGRRRASFSQLAVFSRAILPAQRGLEGISWLRGALCEDPEVWRRARASHRGRGTPSALGFRERWDSLRKKRSRDVGAMSDAPVLPTVCAA
eukprot:scaffold7881_cov258-Pinguiococcus_pyrenoidosus.AAC.1